MKPKVILVLTAASILSSLSTVEAARLAQQDEKTTDVPTQVSAVTMSFESGYIQRNFQFAITLKRDGSAVFIVRRSAGSGTYVAKGLQQEFVQAAKLVSEANFWSLGSHFGPKDPNSPGSVLSVVGSGVRKSIVDAGVPKPKSGARAAPEGIKSLERLLAGLTQTAHWDKISDKLNFPDYRPQNDSKG